MTTRAGEIAGEGPYSVEWSGENRTARVLGPDFVGQWQTEPRAFHRCADMNAAYNQGQQNRWIPLSQFKAPAPGTIILFGSKATVRMWTWDANNDEPPSSWATHFQLIELPPNPEQR